MKSCLSGIALLLLPLLAACAFDDDVEPATFTGPVLQRTALQPSLLAHAYANPTIATRTAVIHSGYVVRFWKGQSICPWAGG